MFNLKHLKLEEVEGEGSAAGGPVVEDEDTVSEEVQALWGELADADDDLVDEEVSEVGEETPEVVAPTAAGEEAPVVEQEALEPAATPAAEIEQPAVPEVEQPKPETAEEYQARMQQVRTDAMSHLEKQFALSEDEATQMMTAPQEVVPKLLAKVFMNVYDAVTHGMVQNLPNIIRNVQQQEVAIEDSRKTFYGAWPKLDPVKHGPTVARIAAVYGQLNPNATPEEIIRDVGAQAMFALKIPVEAETVDEVPAPAPAARPGFRPAGGTPAARSPGQGGTSDNIFTSLAEEFLSDDD